MRARQAPTAPPAARGGPRPGRDRQVDPVFAHFSRNLPEIGHLGSSVRWVESEIDSWIQDQMEQRDQNGETERMDGDIADTA